MYSDALLARFMSPTHAGDLEPAHGTGRGGNITCGDVIHLAIRIEAGLICDARFRAQGCATAIAAADAVCEMSIGSSVTAMEMLDPDKLIELLGGIPADKINCAAIAMEALQLALDQVRSAPLAAGPVPSTSG